MDYRVCNIPDGGNEPEEMREVPKGFIVAVDKLISLHIQEQEGTSAGIPTPKKWKEAVEAIIIQQELIS